MVRENMAFLSKVDPVVTEMISRELNRQRNNLELIASENIVTPAVMAAMGSVLTNKYAEGYPGRRYYGGCEFVDQVENLCIERAKELFGAKFANVQPHSGSQANFAAYMALCKPGDTVMGMDLSCGGHLTHGASVSFSGKLYNIVSYGCDPETSLIDYDQVRELAMKHRPTMIIAGASAYPRVIDFKRFREIADECGAYLMVDMAHIAGLVAAGEHPSPMEHAHVVTTTNHKTLRGPRGGMLFTNDEAIAKKINSAIFPGGQGGPLMHVIAAKAVALGEALQPEFKIYQHNVVVNAAAMARVLIENGIELVTGGTDNHLMLVDLKKRDISGRELENRLDQVRITVNKNKIINDPRSAAETSGIRVGTPAITARGLLETDAEEVAKLLVLAITDFESRKTEIIDRVDVLCKKYPIY
ncbi:MAG: serine hydroxymethyltransferase [Christensenellales bacterium]|nr:serine hydroxymethyltransferase [Christensenellales bacterium]